MQEQNTSGGLAAASPGTFTASPTGAASSTVVATISSAAQGKALCLNCGCILSQQIQKHGTSLNMI
jgi:hypothetical protein